MLPSLLSEARELPATRFPMSSMLMPGSRAALHLKYAQHLTRDTIIQLALDRYSRWMPFLGCNTAEAIDEALG
jgi:hypothetical protein